MKQYFLIDSGSSLAVAAPDGANRLQILVGATASAPAGISHALSIYLLLANGRLI